MITHKIKSAMRNAFENIKVVMPKKEDAKHLEGMQRIGGHIHDANNSGMGVINRPDWNASLSFKTFKMLNAPAYDVPVGKQRYAYDRMVAE